jgi:hypothetical protein
MENYTGVPGHSSSVPGNRKRPIAYQAVIKEKKTGNSDL